MFQSLLFSKWFGIESDTAKQDIHKGPEQEQNTTRLTSVKHLSDKKHRSVLSRFVVVGFVFFGP